MELLLHFEETCKHSCRNVCLTLLGLAGSSASISRVEALRTYKQRCRTALKATLSTAVDKSINQNVEYCLYSLYFMSV